MTKLRCEQLFWWLWAFKDGEWLMVMTSGLGSIENEEDRPYDSPRPLVNRCNWHCPWGRTIGKHKLTTSSEIWLNLLNHQVSIFVGIKHPLISNSNSSQILDILEFEWLFNIKLYNKTIQLTEINWCKKKYFHKFKWEWTHVQGKTFPH